MSLGSSPMWSPSKKNPKIEEKMSTRIPFSRVKNLVLQTLDDNEQKDYTLFWSLI